MEVKNPVSNQGFLSDVEMRVGKLESKGQVQPDPYNRNDDQEINTIVEREPELYCLIDKVLSSSKFHTASCFPPSGNDRLPFHFTCKINKL
jgi:hypothetical protein